MEFNCLMSNRDVGIKRFSLSRLAIDDLRRAQMTIFHLAVITDRDIREAVDCPSAKTSLFQGHSGKDNKLFGCSPSFSVLMYLWPLWVATMTLALTPLTLV